jgi:regulator of extracellular matrix RemA (YlzA/DUF370 family)
LGKAEVKVEAKIMVDFGSVRLAEAVVSAVSPDNKPLPRGLKVETWGKKGKLLGVIKCSRGVKTFLSTLDDLLASVQTAEKAVEMVRGEARKG